MTRRETWVMSFSPDARQRVLDAGVSLLYETGVVAGVSHVKLAAAAGRAGYTTGAAYRCWPSQEDFHRDLARAAILRKERASIADIVADIRPVIDAGAPLLEVLRVGAEANLCRGPDRADFFVSLALRASALSDPELVGASDERVCEGLADHTALFAALAKLYRRRMRPPFTIEHYTAVVAALAEGFAIQDSTGTRHPRLERDGLGDGVGRDWTLFGAVLQIVVEAFTEPECAPVARNDANDEHPQSSVLVEH
jgi:AcrR family transcriptional regulator